MTTDTTDWSAFAQRLARRGERRLVLVEGPRPEALAWLRRQLPTPLWGAGLWTGPANDRPHPALMPVAPARARDWLGRELDLLVWDGWHGNPPDALAALAGHPACRWPVVLADAAAGPVADLRRPRLRADRAWTGPTGTRSPPAWLRCSGPPTR